MSDISRFDAGASTMPARAAGTKHRAIRKSRAWRMTGRDPCPQAWRGERMEPPASRPAVTSCAVGADDVELLHTAIVGFGDAEDEVADRDLLADGGQVAELGGDHAADGVELFVGKVGTGELVEVGDGGERADREHAVVELRGEDGIFLVVVLV